MRVETHWSSFFFSVESSCVPPIPRGFVDCRKLDWLWLSEMKARWQTHLCDYDWLDGRDRPKTKKANLPPGLRYFGLEQWLRRMFFLPGDKGWTIGFWPCGSSWLFFPLSFHAMTSHWHMNWAFHRQIPFDCSGSECTTVNQQLLQPAENEMLCRLIPLFWTTRSNHAHLIARLLTYRAQPPTIPLKMGFLNRRKIEELVSNESLDAPLFLRNRRLQYKVGMSELCVLLTFLQPPTSFQ